MNPLLINRSFSMSRFIVYQPSVQSLVFVSRPSHYLQASLPCMGSAPFRRLALRKSSLATIIMGSALFRPLALRKSILDTMGSAPYRQLALRKSILAMGNAPYRPLALRKSILATVGSAPYRLQALH